MWGVKDMGIAVVVSYSARIIVVQYVMLGSNMSEAS